MKTVGIIPARYASTRFPGKPLVKIGSKSMIQRVYEQSSKAIENVYVATDDGRIEQEVLRFGGNVIMTKTTHQSGTDRCLEVIEKLESRYEIYDIAVNIQGDEPFIQPIQIQSVISCFYKHENQIATLRKKMTENENIFNPNAVKVITNSDGIAIYFSRFPIPYFRNDEKENWTKKHDYYKHIGIYGYRCSVLKKIANLPQSSLEKAESLEQLRWIENGFKIATAITDFENLAVDTQQDLQNLLNQMKDID